jgi:transposase
MRYELADYEWDAIKPMLPNKPRGVPRRDRGLTLQAMRNYRSVVSFCIGGQGRSSIPWDPAALAHGPRRTSTSRRGRYWAGCNRS